ncbi:MAG TPA: cupredoxin domain-containing protein [Candidatus Babeliales bacterium]|nr:cupredoxin domain-containing protein [Candidatus Babeliales bacterium]
MDDETTNPMQSDTTEGPGTRMWRNPPWSLLIAVLILLVIVIVVAISHNPTKNNTTSIAKQSAQIAVTSSQFVPQVLDVKVGSSVVWTNQDSSPHWIASDPYPKDDTLKSLNSGGPKQKGESFTYTFDKAGTFTYHDELHPAELKGTVRVK